MWKNYNLIKFKGDDKSFLLFFCGNEVVYWLHLQFFFLIAVPHSIGSLLNNEQWILHTSNNQSHQLKCGQLRHLTSFSSHTMWNSDGKGRWCHSFKYYFEVFQKKIPANLSRIIRVIMKCIKTNVHFSFALWSRRQAKWNEDL